MSRVHKEQWEIDLETIQSQDRERERAKERLAALESRRLQALHALYLKTSALVGECRNTESMGFTLTTMEKDIIEAWDAVGAIPWKP